MANNIPSGYELGKIQQFTPEQMNLFKTMFGNVGPDSYLGKLAGGDQATFDQMEKPALRQFNELQGGLASRFSGMGMGGRRSSGFQNTSTQAASNLSQNLQSQRQQLQMQALQQLMGMSNQLLGQRPNEQFLTKKQQRPSFWESMIPMAGGIAGGMMGGPAGASMGSQLAGGMDNMWQSLPWDVW